MKTIKYYTNTGHYKGWNKYNSLNIQEAKDWIRNGHTLIINNKTIKQCKQ